MTSLAGGTPSLGTGGLGGTGIGLPQTSLGAGALQLGGGLGATFSAGQGVSAGLPGPPQLGGLPSGGLLGGKAPTLQLGGGGGGGIALKPASEPGTAPATGLILPAPTSQLAGSMAPTMAGGTALGGGGGFSLKQSSGAGTAPAAGLILSAPSSQPAGSMAPTMAGGPALGGGGGFSLKQASGAGSAPAAGLIISAPGSQLAGSMAAAVAGGTPLGGGGIQLPKPQLTSQPTLTLRPAGQTTATVAAALPTLAGGLSTVPGPTTVGLQLPGPPTGTATTLGTKLVLCICIYTYMYMYIDCVAIYMCNDYATYFLVFLAAHALLSSFSYLHVHYLAYISVHTYHNQ